MEMSASGRNVVVNCVRKQIVGSSGARQPAGESDPEAEKHNEWSPLSSTVSTRGRISNQQAFTGRSSGGKTMQVVYDCCAGLDVHKETVSVCIGRCEANGQKRQQVRVYGTFTKDLLALVDWLQENGVTHVAREAT